jgi:hypothetical protein
MTPFSVNKLLWIILFRTPGGPWKLSETERAIIKYGLFGLTIILAAWGITVLVRYYYRGEMIRKKMRWSHANDSLWNYDAIIAAARDNYIKAQVLLNSNPSVFLKRLSPYARARLRLFKKQVRSGADIEFPNAYVVCFDDKQNNAQDSVAVYLDVLVKRTVKFSEILIMHREFDEWKITEYVKNPTIFMISHARSIVEKS